VIRSPDRGRDVAALSPDERRFDAEDVLVQRIEPRTFLEERTTPMGERRISSMFRF
jgi:hypothetical protein